LLVGIHQPHYLPWLRYFEKVARSDVFIILDDVQYEKNGFQNRNKIKTAQGWMYLTVPVLKPTQRPIYEIEIDERSGWRDKHRRAIEMSYRKAPYFEEYWPDLAAIYESPWERLGELNTAMLRLLQRQLGDDTPMHSSRALAVQGESTERLAALCHAVGGDEYLSGAYAVQAYLDPQVLKNAGIRLAFQEWQAPEYQQLYPGPGFVRDLAILDLIFNEGPNARDILLQSGSVTYPEL
jgi:hypothetical protein